MADTAELAIVHATTASASWLTDPTVFAANRKPASHRYVIGETSEPKQSLDGEWKVRIEQARNVDVESAPFAAVDFEALISAGFVSSNDKVKILGNGTLSKGLAVKAHAFSKSAEAAIVAAGGSVEKI